MALMIYFQMVKHKWYAQACRWSKRCNWHVMLSWKQSTRVSAPSRRMGMGWTSKLMILCCITRPFISCEFQTCKCLTIFSTFQAHCQGSTVSIAQVIPMVKSILEQLQSIYDRGGVFSFRLVLIRMLKFYFLGGSPKRQYPKVTESKLHLMATAIDPRFREVLPFKLKKSSFQVTF